MKQFLSLIFIFVFAGLAVSSGSTSCKEESYNNAWKVLQSLRYGYVWYNTYESPRRCAFLSRESLNESANSAVYVGTYNTQDDANYQDIRKEIIASSSCPSIMTVYFSGVDEPDELTVVYSDYKYCLIDRDPKFNNGCRFWVANGATENQAQECKPYFDKECGTNQNLVYDRTSCTEGRVE